MTAIPLPVWPHSAIEEHIDVLKQAKASLNSGLKIKPEPAYYGSPGRVLCFGETPDFLATLAPVRAENVGNVASVAAALKLCLAEMEGWHPDPRFGEDWLLSKWMGAEVRLLGEERYDADAMRWEPVYEWQR